LAIIVTDARLSVRAGEEARSAAVHVGLVAVLDIVVAVPLVTGPTFRVAQGGLAVAALQTVLAHATAGTAMSLVDARSAAILVGFVAVHGAIRTGDTRCSVTIAGLAVGVLDAAQAVGAGLLDGRLATFRPTTVETGLSTVLDAVRTGDADIHVTLLGGTIEVHLADEPIRARQAALLRVAAIGSAAVHIGLATVQDAIRARGRRADAGGCAEVGRAVS
jgi:hypothetical protein